jgi:chemotaxis signal transduction protein
VADERPLALFFMCGQERLAVRASSVRKVVHVEGRSRLPRVPPVFAGIAHHQGRLCTLIDLSFACFARPTVRDDGLVLLLEGNHRAIGLLVDEVGEAEPVRVDALLPGPHPSLRVLGHRNQPALWLDVDVFVTSVMSAASTAG